ncbi:protein PIGMENT DEFECTIVE 338, chloroplastic isoform X1 [Arachis duranensis]|uniref:Protein PIGMENT DEFECTIVE 338, chloroplastic isoform X1 n=1 Tax=Arachis duranensis TaxID=130453 RepID=A0A6P4DGI6_ARADU|nr:protein PIGMENT DEFECTIVE 338, chloroplastic isoform X1 [Arachis duranensis]
MPLILCPCQSLCFPNWTLPLSHVTAFRNNFHRNPMKLPYTERDKFSILRAAHVEFSSISEKFDGFSSNQSSQEALDGEGTQDQEHAKLELRNKPSPTTAKNEVVRESERGSTEDEALSPFLKFFKENGSVEEREENDGLLEVSKERDDMVDESEEVKKDNAEYYEPKPGDFVIGVVVSGTESKLNVNVGAELLATMLTKEVLPLNTREMEHLLFDLEKDEQNFNVQGRMGILKNEDAINGIPVAQVGTVVFAEVLGRTLTDRALLSSRRLFRRIAWHRLRQIKQYGESIEVRITEWNTRGLLTRIEGLRAFLPKAELMKRVNNVSELKENVGRCIYVQITQVDEDTTNLVLSEREAWEKLYLQEGTLLEGTVNKILPYGAQIRIGETNRCGLLHVSNITRAEISSVSDILSVDEKLKVLVVKSTAPDKISLSIADLESEPGLFLSDKQRVFLEADMMAKKYKENIHHNHHIIQESEPLPNSVFPFENETLYANWKWVRFEK